MDRRSLRATVHGGYKRAGHELVTKQQQQHNLLYNLMLASVAQQNKSAMYISTPFWISLPLVLFILFIYSFNFFLCWVFIVVQAFLQLWQLGASLQLWSGSVSLWQPLLLQVTGSRALRFQQVQLLGSRAGSVVGIHELSCSGKSEVFPDQRWNHCLQHGRQIPGFLSFIFIKTFSVKTLYYLT